MLHAYNLIMPHQVFAGADALSNITELLKMHQVKQLAIFTDKGIWDAGLLELPLQFVKAAGVSYIVLDDLPAEPSYGEAQRLVDQCRNHGADFIIAVGGGSVMDTAKLSSILMTDAYGIKELLDQPLLGKKQIRTLMIPTTAGTGSEATPNAIVAVPEKQLKIGIVNQEMVPDYVILDARMIKKLPRRIAAATGVDALAHAIECWTSKKANPFSDLYARQALELILGNIDEACDDENAMDAKTKMQLASFYAGVAITASGTTAVHALSYPLGGKYHIAHGVSNAMLLVPVMTFNEPACRDRLAAVYDLCIRGGETTVEGKSRAVIARLGSIVEHLDIPTSLSEFHVPSSDLEQLVDAGMQVTRLLVNNMREVTADDARRIYQTIL